VGAAIAGAALIGIVPAALANAGEKPAVTDGADPLGKMDEVDAVDVEAAVEAFAGDIPDPEAPKTEASTPAEQSPEATKVDTPAAVETPADSQPEVSNSESTPVDNQPVEEPAPAESNSQPAVEPDTGSAAPADNSVAETPTVETPVTEAPPAEVPPTEAPPVGESLPPETPPTEQSERFVVTPSDPPAAREPTQPAPADESVGARNVEAESDAGTGATTKAPVTSKKHPKPKAIHKIIEPRRPMVTNAKPSHAPTAPTRVAAPVQASTTSPVHAAVRKPHAPSLVSAAKHVAAIPAEPAKLASSILSAVNPIASSDATIVRTSISGHVAIDHPQKRAHATVVGAAIDFLFD
jgi:hypothetical protein